MPGLRRRIHPVGAPSTGSSSSHGTRLGPRRFRSDDRSIPPRRNDRAPGHRAMPPRDRRRLGPSRSSKGGAQAGPLAAGAVGRAGPNRKVRRWHTAGFAPPFGGGEPGNVRGRRLIQRPAAVMIRPRINRRGGHVDGLVCAQLDVCWRVRRVVSVGVGARADRRLESAAAAHLSPATDLSAPSGRGASRRPLPAIRQ